MQLTFFSYLHKADVFIVNVFGQSWAGITSQCVLEFDNKTMHDAPSTKWK